MYTTRTHKLLGSIAGGVLGLAISVPTWAAFGGSPGQAVKGTVQGIDYLHHAITVNGQTYTVAQNANFNGVASFSVLHIGMPIAYTLGGAPLSQVKGPGAMPATGPAAMHRGAEDPSAQTAEDGPQVITSITWLPGGI